jgi:hypothetical protein
MQALVDPAVMKAISAGDLGPYGQSEDHETYEKPEGPGDSEEMLH